MSLVLKQARAVLYWPPKAQTLKDDELVHIRSVRRTQALITQKVIDKSMKYWCLACSQRQHVWVRETG